MPKELYLKQKFEIESIDRAEGINANYEFVAIEDGFDILIAVSEELREIEANTKFEISEELQQSILSHLILDESYVEGRQEQINDGTANAQRNLVKAVQKLVDLMEFGATSKKGNLFVTLMQAGRIFPA